MVVLGIEGSEGSVSTPSWKILKKREFTLIMRSKSVDPKKAAAAKSASAALLASHDSAHMKEVMSVELQKPRRLDPTTALWGATKNAIDAAVR